MTEGANKDNAWLLKGFIAAFALCVVTSSLLYLTFNTMYKGSALRVFAMAFGVVGFILSMSCIAWFINYYITHILNAESFQVSLPKFCLFCTRRVGQDMMTEDSGIHQSLPRTYSKMRSFTDKTSSDILNCKESRFFVENKRDESETTIVELDNPGTDPEGNPNSLFQKLFESDLQPSVNLEVLNEHQSEASEQLINERQGEANSQLINERQGEASAQLINKRQRQTSAQLMIRCQGTSSAERINERQGKVRAQLISKCQTNASVHLLNEHKCETTAQYMNASQGEAGARSLMECVSEESEDLVKAAFVSPCKNSNLEEKVPVESVMSKSEEQCEASELQKESSSSFRNDKRTDSTVRLPTDIEENSLFTNYKEIAPSIESHKISANNKDVNSSLVQTVVDRSGIVTHFKRFLRLSWKRRGNKKCNPPASPDDRDPFEVKLDAFILFPPLVESPQPSPAIHAKCSSVKKIESARGQPLRRTRTKQASCKLLPIITEKTKSTENAFPSEFVDAMNSILNRKENNFLDEISLGYTPKQTSRHSNLSSWVFTRSEDSFQNSVKTLYSASEGCSSTPFSSTTSLNDPINSESSMVSNMNLFRTFNRRVHLSSPSIASNYF